MRTARSYSTILIGVGLAVALAAAAASAQTAAPAKQAAAAAKAQPAPAPAPQSGAGLTEEQRQSIAELRKQHRAAMEPLQEQLQAARKSLRDASRAETFDENAVRAAASALATAQAEIAVSQARHRSQFLGLLTPEQRQHHTQIEERQMIRRERLERRLQMIRERALQQGAGAGMGGGRGRRMMGPRWRDPLMMPPDAPMRPRKEI